MTQRLERVEAVLDAWLPEQPGVAWLRQSMGREEDVGAALAAALTRPGWDLVNRGGKRWRPLLMVLTAEAAAGGGDAPGAVNAALALTPLVEFPHNASLIHDDIEDNAETRRGGPAVHLRYGVDTAINSGAFLYFLPLACLEAAPLPADTKLAVYRVWGEHLRRLHLGQAMDIAWHRDPDAVPALADYETMCRLKTGCLASLAACLGVLCAGACADSARADNADAAGARAGLVRDLGRGAETLGVGFQILDDVKNLTHGVPGKARGDDVVEGKKSLPLLLFLHRYPERRGFAARCLAAARAGGVAAPEIERFIEALAAAGVLEEARDRGLGLIRESRGVFTAAFPGAGGAALAALIDGMGS